MSSKQEASTALFFLKEISTGCSPPSWATACSFFGAFPHSLSRLASKWILTGSSFSHGEASSNLSAQGRQAGLLQTLLFFWKICKVTFWKRVKNIESNSIRGSCCPVSCWAAEEGNQHDGLRQHGHSNSCIMYHECSSCSKVLLEFRKSRTIPLSRVFGSCRNYNYNGINLVLTCRIWNQCEDNWSRGNFYGSNFRACLHVSQNDILAWVGGDLNLVPTPCWCHTVHQTAQGLMQSSLELLQGWGIHIFFAQPIPAPDQKEAQMREPFNLLFRTCLSP